MVSAQEMRAIARMVRNVVAEEVRRVRVAVQSSVSRFTLSALNTSGQCARVAGDLRDDEARDDVELLEPYGFTSAPPAGAEGVALSVGGDGGHHVVLALGNRSLRLKGLKSGEVAVYAEFGQSILLNAAGDIILVPKAGRDVLLGDAGATKKVALADDVDDRLAALQTAFDAHMHATAAPGPPVVPTPVPGVIPVGPLAPTGADNVKGKG